MRINKSPAETALSRAVIRWGLGRPSLVAETPTSFVYRVQQRGGEPAALKLIRPGMTEEIRGTVLLAWYGGEGAARVIDATGEAVLMEWLGGSDLIPTVAAGGDEQAAECIAGVAGRLLTRRGEPPAGMMPLADRLQALTSGNRALWPEAGRDLFARAAGMAMRLLDTPAPQVPLHGDLHHANVLYADRGWLAIDPKGLIGDPAYEPAATFINPIDQTRLCTDPKRIERLASIFSTRLGLDRARVLRYAAVHAAAGVCWALEDGVDPRHGISVLERLVVLTGEGG